MFQAFVTVTGKNMPALSWALEKKLRKNFTTNCHGEFFGFTSNLQNLSRVRKKKNYYREKNTAQQPLRTTSKLRTLAGS